MNLNDEIAKVAHELFERDGRRHGRDLEHWLEAEKIVKARYEKLQKMKKGDGEAPKPAKSPARAGARKAGAAKAEAAATAKAKKTK